MAHIGQHVLYTVPPEHETKTKKGDQHIEGSIFHPEQKTFAGVVGRVHPDGSADIHLFVPNREGKWVDAVNEGDGRGSWRNFAHPGDPKASEPAPAVDGHGSIGDPGGTIMKVPPTAANSNSEAEAKARFDTALTGGAVAGAGGTVMKETPPATGA